ncbi:MAG: T9SS type A sorting domain-containing protein [Bacteroidota bacterium]
MRKSTFSAPKMGRSIIYAFFLLLLSAPVLCDAQIIILIEEGNRGGGIYQSPVLPTSTPTLPSSKVSFTSGQGSGISFSVVPNPASTTDNITLSVLTGVPTDIKVSDSQGTILYQSPTSSASSLHTLYLDPGMYYVSLGDGSSWESKILSIQ